MDREKILTEKRDFEKKLEAIRKSMKGKGKEFVTDALKPIFEKHPELLAVRWQQYTPYFNDGDSCKFSSTHSDYPQVKIKGDGDFEECCHDELEKAITEALNVFTDDDMESFFGDHMEVTVRRSGTVKVEEYEHD